MSRQIYRTELEIVSSILELMKNAGIVGVGITAISRAVNLSHSVTVAKCEKLIKSGLIMTRSEEKNKMYSLTEEGIKFYHLVGEFNDLVDQVRTPAFKNSSLNETSQ